MSVTRQHSDWLSLLDISGPFLSIPVLIRVFPQGLDAHDPDHYRGLKLAYQQYLDSLESRSGQSVHRQWIRFVINETLGLTDDLLLEGQSIPPGIEARIAEHGETIRPDIVFVNPSSLPNAGKPRMLIQILDSKTSFSRAIAGKRWSASPETRMMELLHATSVKLGLVTNGKQWMLVHAPVGETSSYITWHADIWFEEKITLQAFRSLLSLQRFCAPDCDTLEALFTESAENQQEVTTQLGYQVRKAVEVLVQAIDRADKDLGRKLLTGIKEKSLYDASLTVMMRLVFMFAAEEKGLLYLDDDFYVQNYAVSTMRDQLREEADKHGEEILERRNDAWCRLLAAFRIVHAGIHHDRLSAPPYGGHLFDPDKYAFLEGRKPDQSWRDTPSDPLPINNRAVLHLLEALQILQVKVPGGGAAEARRLSFRALDIEQIGHVYEGLLDHTAKIAKEPILGLVGSRDHEEEVPLSHLEALAGKGIDPLVKELKELTGKTESSLRKLIENPPLVDEGKLRTACDNDDQLAERIKPFIGLLRKDTSDGYEVIVTGSVYVTKGSDRRTTGTHYTPRSLTEPVVQYTLEPLVYEGPSEGKPKEEWKLKSTKEILKLKICDMAMGSGAFLVQACRFLSECLVEAWEDAETASGGYVVITPEGDLANGAPEERPIPKDADERLTIARRIIADRCLYGVDKNPMAVEMAKLSLWLTTMAKDKPFSFLDHALKCGDSLLGVDVAQFSSWTLDRTGGTKGLALGIQKDLDEALLLRSAIEGMTDDDIGAVEEKARLNAKVEKMLERIRLAGDLIIGPAFWNDNEQDEETLRANLQARYSLETSFNSQEGLDALRDQANLMLGGNTTFHWPFEFPEVFLEGGRNGFDAMIGNPPFRGGLMITSDFGLPYTLFLKSQITNAGATTDLCAYFFRQVFNLLSKNGCMGYLASNTISEGDTRQASLTPMVDLGATIYRAISSTPWPGEAALHIAIVWTTKNSKWAGSRILDGNEVCFISPSLKDQPLTDPPMKLTGILSPAFLGTTVYGRGYFLSLDETEMLIKANPRNRRVVKPFLNGEDVLEKPEPSPSRWVLYFQGMTLDEVKEFKEPYSIAKERVFLERQRSSSIGRRQNWWLYTSPAADLYSACEGKSRVIVTCFTSKHVVFTFMSTDMIFSNAVIVIASEEYGHLAILQSAVHECWVREHSSTLETRQRYALSDCYMTFPPCSINSGLNKAGNRMSEHRQSVMRERAIGLTTIYNYLNDGQENATDIGHLRELQIQMDQAVADAYGWNDLDLGHGFHQTKQGLRYAISEPARCEVLDRLLLLNHERYEEEVKQGLHEKGSKKPVARTSRKSKTSGPSMNLPGMG